MLGETHQAHLQNRKLRLREVELFTQGHTARPI